MTDLKLKEKANEKASKKARQSTVAATTPPKLHQVNSIDALTGKTPVPSSAVNLQGTQQVAFPKTPAVNATNPVHVFLLLCQRLKRKSKHGKTLYQVALLSKLS